MADNNQGVVVEQVVSNVVPPSDEQKQFAWKRAFGVTHVKGAKLALKTLGEYILMAKGLPHKVVTQRVMAKDNETLRSVVNTMLTDALAAKLDAHKEQFNVGEITQVEHDKLVADDKERFKEAASYNQAAQYHELATDAKFIAQWCNQFGGTINTQKAAGAHDVWTLDRIVHEWFGFKITSRDMKKVAGNRQGVLGHVV